MKSAVTHHIHSAIVGGVIKDQRDAGRHTPGGLESAYVRLLEGVASWAGDIGPRPIAAHWPFVGSSYRGLVVVGQALQGWDAAETPARWTAADTLTPEGRQRVLDRTRRWAISHAEPLSEVLRLGHRAGSPFWTISRHLVPLLEADGSGPWFGRCAWWNVFPLGWDEPGAGPTGALWDVQLPHLADLFWSAMDQISAKRVVLVSGRSWWWWLRDMLDLGELTPGRAPVLASGAVRGLRVVASYHPRGARQLGIRDAEQVKAIAEAMAER